MRAGGDVARSNEEGLTIFDKAQLDRIEATQISLLRWAARFDQYLSRITQMENIIMAQADDFEAELAANTSVVSGVQSLIAKFIADAQAAHDAGDPARMQAVLDKWKTNDATLAGLVAANTPAAPSA